jgi:hypothetical protein
MAYSNGCPLSKRVQRVPVRVSPAPVVFLTLLLLIGVIYFTSPFVEISLIALSPSVIMPFIPKGF